MAPRSLVALLIVGVVGCGGGTPPSSAVHPSPASSPSLDALLERDIAPHLGIPWSAARRLTWSDFQGAPPPGGEEAAKTAYGIYYAWKCRGRAFEFRVVAAFHPNDSWVKPMVLGDSSESRRVLAHEQTHFNIAEVYARRMRRRFAALSSPCARSDDQLGFEARRILDEERAFQRRYDAETGHGLERREQTAWEAEIRRQLAGG